MAAPATRAGKGRGFFAENGQKGCGWRKAVRQQAGMAKDDRHESAYHLFAYRKPINL